MEKLTYFFFRAFVFLFSIAPFRLVYFFSDGIFYLIYHIIGYRKKVVMDNLVNSFPEKSKEEITRIAKAFYRHFCDIMIESGKAFTMDEETITRRFVFTNPEILDEYFFQGRNVIVAGAHYNNWEWAGLASGTQLKHKPVGFYKPLSNKLVDQYIQKTRVRGRSVLASIKRTEETFHLYSEPSAFYMIADQSPSTVRMAYWVNFMGRETPFLHGPEKHARLNNLPVYYANIQKVRRGYYEVELILVEAEPLTVPQGSITAKYAKILEDKIREKPEFWLWSHKRWKHQRGPKPA
jgi:Kdo2-lipid IVA lauroyltransferase/acyltransferase